MNEANVQQITPGDPETRSEDVVGANVAQLGALFPEAIVEGRIDFDVLRQLLGGAIEDREEKYGLKWHGKRRARQLALTPSTGTLRPCPEESVDWDATQNLMIEGDNLEVLKLLQKSYAGKVKLIYIDPPYNTGNDFVYPDDFRDNIKNYLELTGQVDGAGRRLSTNTEASGRFHTDWLNMMYPRLKLARNLLREDGIFFVSIADGELATLRLLCDEVFGEENLIETFVWESIFRPSNMSRSTRKNCEFVLGYVRSDLSGLEMVERRADPQGEASLTQNNNRPRSLAFPADYVEVLLPDGEYPPAAVGEVELQDPLVVRSSKAVSPFRITGKFKWSQQYLDDEIAKGVRLIIKTASFIPYYRKDYQQTALRPTKLLSRDLVGDVLAANAELAAIFPERIYDYPKPTSLVTFLASAVGCAGDDIVLDFFAGSGTSGHAVMARNATTNEKCRHVMVQLPEPLDPNVEAQGAAARFCQSLGRPANVAEITKERLRRAGVQVRAQHSLVEADTGFRVFKLDSTNIQAWEPVREDLEGTLEGAVEHLKEERTEQDILYELLLKLGLDLCVPIERREIAGNRVHAVGGGALLVCLAASIGRADVEELANGIAGWFADLAPAGDATCVFRDSAFEDDVAKTNMAAILAQRGLARVRSL